jgi:hypothetical protein
MADELKEYTEYTTGPITPPVVVDGYVERHGVQIHVSAAHDNPEHIIVSVQLASWFVDEDRGPYYEPATKIRFIPRHDENNKRINKLDEVSTVISGNFEEAGVVHLATPEQVLETIGLDYRPDEEDRKDESKLIQFGVVIQIIENGIMVLGRDR